MKKFLAILLCLIIIAISLSSCSGGSSTQSDNNGLSISDNAKGIAGINDYNNSYESENDDVNENDSNNDSKSKSDKETTQAETSEEKLVYTCSLSIETTDYDTTMDALSEQIKKYKGIIESETERDSDDTWYYKNHTKSSSLTCNITVRIPSADFNNFLDSIEGAGKITDKTMNVENITSSYNDTEATISALEIQQTRLLQMLKEADNVNDMMAIEQRLTEVEGQLNRYKTELGTMDTKVAYSTISINVKEVGEYSKDAPSEKTFGDRLSNTLHETWEFFLNLLEWLLFFLIRILPLAVIFGLIAIIIVIIVKKNIKKNKAKEAKQLNNFNNQNMYQNINGCKNQNIFVPANHKPVDLNNNSNKVNGTDTVLEPNKNTIETTDNNLNDKKGENND